MKRWRDITLFSAAALLMAGAGGCAPRMTPPDIKTLTAPPPIFGVYAQVTIFPKGEAALRFPVLWWRTREAEGEGVVDALELQTPVGSTEARLRMDAAGATLQRRGEEFHAESGAALARHFLGRDLPVKAFGFWMVGEPDPDAPATVTRNVFGQAMEMAQFGWNIQYLDRDYNNLPKAMELSTEGLVVKIKVRKWLPS